MISSMAITKFGEITVFKCHLQIILLSLSLTFIYIPILIQLIIYFPDSNKYSDWVNRNKYLLFLMFILIDTFLNGLTFIKTFEVKDIYIDEGKNFQKCESRNALTIVSIAIIILYKLIIIIGLLLLIFIEWNLKETALDVKYLATALFMDTLSLITLIIFNKIKINNYVLYNLVLAINILVFAVSNHIFIYLVRVLPVFRPNTKFDDSRKILGKISSSGLNGTNKRTFANSYNKPTMSSSSSFNKNSMAFYSNLANSPYSNRGTSFYNNDPTSSNNSIGTSSYNSNVGISSYNNNIGTSSYNNNMGSYNKRSNTSNNKYSMPSNYSPNNTDFRKSTTSSGSGSTKRGGLTKRIMDYHNQTDIYP